jgi:hypothetical protein
VREINTTGQQWVGELWTQEIPDPKVYRQRQDETVRILRDAVVEAQEAKLAEEAESKCPS